jgi:hypothetical protein
MDPSHDILRFSEAVAKLMKEASVATVSVVTYRAYR